MTSQTSRRPTEQVSLRTLALIAALGILLRVIIAYAALPPDAGFAADLNSFRSWASELGTRGPWGFYARGMFVDYLPGYMWVLWALGSLGALVTGSTDPGALIKLPAILADGLLVFATARLAADLGAPRRGQLVAAVAMAVGPMIWLDSAVWGQVDSVGTAALLLSLSALIRGKTVRIGIEAPVDVRVMRAEIENPPSECHCFGCETRRNQKRNELAENLRRFFGTDKPRFVADEDVREFNDWMKGR